MPTTVVLFRLDLRLADNPALSSARGPVVPAFVWSPDEDGPWPPGAASRWWLHQSLKALDADLRSRGSRLVIRAGPTLDAVRDLVRETSAEAVVWNRRYEPAAIARDGAMKAALKADGLNVESFNGSLIVEPWELPAYKVFAPYWNAATKREVPAALPRPKLVAPPTWPSSLPLESLRLEPTIDWAGGMRAHWTPGEAGAGRRLQRFVRDALADYAEGREPPANDGRSGLSPHLHFGEVSPRAVWHAAHGRAGAEPFLKEVLWRDFAHQALFHNPHTPERPLRPAYERFPWRTDAAALRAWRRGRTGYPLVDAGMRQLWSLGWMHNRVRMVVGSFLVKHLLISWREGAAWFWDTLVDADLANNTLNWQWSAGCGADAAPYFRIFSPVAQGEKFDPDGEYVRRWVPELSRVPASLIHHPWDAPASLTDGYPPPVVEHRAARARALEALATIKGG